MRKHIFGFALFSFIFLSFAAVFALFRAAPVVNVAVEEILPPNFTVEKETYCPKRTQSNALSYEIIGSYFFYDESRIVSRIRISWNRNTPPPAKIYVTTKIASASGENIFVKGSGIESPFAESNSQIITVVSRISNRESVKDSNLYVSANVTDDKDSVNYEKSNGAPPTQVIFVHGESSIIKK